MTDEHIRIRAAGPDDALAVAEVLEGAGLSVAGLNVAGLNVAGLDLGQPDSGEGGTFWLLTYDGEPVGAVGLERGGRERGRGDEGASLLRGAAVLPDFRGQGLGRALVLSAVTGAQLRGDSAVYLFSTGGDWHGFGFEPVALSELREALPDAPQLRGGALPGPECWVRRLMPVRSPERGA